MSGRYDVVVVGGGFAGLALAAEIGDRASVLVLEARRRLGDGVQTTGICTRSAAELLEPSVPLARYAVRPIRRLCVHRDPGGGTIESAVERPWCWTTRPGRILEGLAERCGPAVEIRTGTRFLAAGNGCPAPHPLRVRLRGEDGESEVRTRFLVGADGPTSRVAREAGLDRNASFLVASEAVYLAESAGPAGDETIHLSWTAAAPGYGAWIAPNRHDGRPALQVGSATWQDGPTGRPAPTDELVREFERRGLVRLADARPVERLGGRIPIGGVLGRTARERVFLLGDAAGLCGALLGDGIKTALLSARAGGSLLRLALDGRRGTLEGVAQAANGMASYLRRQRRDRALFDFAARRNLLDPVFEALRERAPALLSEIQSRHRDGRSLMPILFHPAAAPRLWRVAGALARALLKLPRGKRWKTG